MYAVIRAGGKQYRVAPGDVIKIETTAADKNGKVEFSDVLAVSAEAGKIGKPNGGGAMVTGEVVDEGRGKKILVFKFKRKKQYKKMIGHRQNFTQVRITEIAFDGQKFSAPDQPARKPKKSKLVEAAETVGAVAGTVAKVAKAVSKSPAKKKAAAKKPSAKRSAAKKPAPKKKK